jgi:hypothetical protein
MKTCHLHIGMHKTGSSSIQHYLDKNRSKLKDSGFYYAEMGASNHSGPFLYAIRFEPDKDSELLFIDMTSEQLKDRVNLYKKKLEDSLSQEYTDIIFSAESITKLTKDELIAFKEYLLRFVDEIKIYCYIREPLSYITSAFQQVIKGTYIQIDHASIYPNYKEKLEKFETVFGNLEYHLFSKSSLTNGNVVNDFCNWLKIPFLGNQDTNLSLSALAVKFLVRFQYARTKLMFSQQSVEMLEYVLSTLPYEKLILPTYSMKEELNDNLTDFQWISNELIIKKTGFIFNNYKLNDYSYGNFLGVFNEFEKSLLINLVNHNDKLTNYIKTETGLNIIDLVNAPLSNIPNLQIYINKINKFSIGGRAFYTDNSQQVTLDIYVNNEFISTILANGYREDLSFLPENERFIGYLHEFKFPLTKNELITLKVCGEIVFSGTFFD